MSWREIVLQKLQPEVSNLIVVYDPDGLVLEERVLSSLRTKGFDVLRFEDPIAFRYAYEANYRVKLDAGENIRLIVVLDDASDKHAKGLADRFGLVPYDIWHIARKVSVGLADLFPKLSYPIVATIDRSSLDRLYEAYQGYHGQTMGDRETKDFILQHVYGIVPGMINSPVHLLKMLLSRHCNLVTLPEVLDQHLIHTLKRKPVFNHWPLEAIIPDRTAFFAFLQDRWQRFLEAIARGEEFAELPFQDYDVRVYIDNLFLEGYLKPVPVASTQNLPGWVLPGVQFDRHAEDLRKTQWLLGRIRKELPGEDAYYRDWQRMATLWAEVLVFYSERAVGLGNEINFQVEEVHNQLEECFETWMLTRYGSLTNLPYTSKPVMVHHIPRYLAHLRSKHPGRKIALVVVDALALDQWLIVRNILRDKRPGWHLEENLVFAWVPTLTSVSRQALFAANPPFYFGDSLTTTGREPQHWTRFWESQGVKRDGILYRKGLGEDLQAEIGDLLDSRYEVVGLIVDKVDKIAHGMELGTVGMHQQVRLWAEQGYLEQLVDHLLKKGFDVYVTSDHGNIAARGTGLVADGVLAETQGLRARIYQSEVLRQQMLEGRDYVVSWPGFGLPKDCYVILSKGRTAFAHGGEEVISHGGISLEEVMVPFVRIWEEK